MERAPSPPPVGRGRPPVRWQLTAIAAELFPDRHADLTVELIGSIRAALGEEGLERVLEARGQAQLVGLPEGAPRSCRQLGAGPGAPPGRGAQRRGLPGRGEVGRGRVPRAGRAPLPGVRRGVGLPGPLPDRARAVPGGAWATTSPSSGSSTCCRATSAVPTASPRLRRRPPLALRLAPSRCAPQCVLPLVGGRTAASHRQRSSGGSSLGPTWASSHAEMGPASRHRPSTRSLALAVCSQAATGHPRQTVRPLRRSRSMRGWSLA